MLLLSFACCYLAMTALALAMGRPHKQVLDGAPSDGRCRGLRLGALLAMASALALAVGELGGEIGGVIWLCQLMLAGLLLVAVLAWRARWVLPLVAILPLGGTLLALT